jgi:hypothetical protein
VLGSRLHRRLSNSPPEHARWQQAIRLSESYFPQVRSPLKRGTPVDEERATLYLISLRASDSRWARKK